MHERHIKPVADEGDIARLAAACDQMHATVLAALPDCVGARIKFTRVKAKGETSHPMFGIDADFRDKSQRDTAVTLINANAIPALHGCTVTVTNHPTSKTLNSITIMPGAAN